MPSTMTLPSGRLDKLVAVNLGDETGSSLPGGRGVALFTCRKSTPNFAQDTVSRRTALSDLRLALMRSHNDNTATGTLFARHMTAQSRHTCVRSDLLSV